MSILEDARQVLKLRKGDFARRAGISPDTYSRLIHHRALLSEEVEGKLIAAHRQAIQEVTARRRQASGRDNTLPENPSSEGKGDRVRSIETGGPEITRVTDSIQNRRATRYLEPDTYVETPQFHDAASQLDEDEVRILVLWGPSGIGKTVLARLLLLHAKRRGFKRIPRPIPITDRFRVDDLVASFKGINKKYLAVSTAESNKVPEFLSLLDRHPTVVACLDDYQNLCDSSVDDVIRDIGRQHCSHVKLVLTSHERLDDLGVTGIRRIQVRGHHDEHWASLILRARDPSLDLTSDQLKAIHAKCDGQTWPLIQFANLSKERGIDHALNAELQFLIPAARDVSTDARRLWVALSILRIPFPPEFIADLAQVHSPRSYRNQLKELKSLCILEELYDGLIGMHDRYKDDCRSEIRGASVGFEVHLHDFAATTLLKYARRRGAIGTLCLRESLHHAEQASWNREDPVRFAKLLCEFAERVEQVGQLDTALDHYARCVELGPDVGEPFWQSYMGLANIHHMRGNRHELRNVVEAWSAQADKISEPQRICEVTGWWKVRLLRLEGQPQEVLPLLESVIERFADQIDLPGQLILRTVHARVTAEHDPTARVDEVISQCWTITNQAEDPIERMNCLRQLSTLIAFDSQWEEMKRIHDVRYDLASRFPESMRGRADRERIEALLGISHALRNMGQIHEWIRKGADALERAKQFKNEFLIRHCLGSLSEAHFAVGDYKRALPLFKEHLDRAQRVGDNGGIGYALWGIGRIKRLSGHPKQAMVKLELAAAHRLRKYEYSGAAYAYTDAARAAADAGDLAKAVEYLDRADRNMLLMMPYYNWQNRNLAVELDLIRARRMMYEGKTSEACELAACSLETARRIRRDDLASEARMILSGI